MKAAFLMSILFIAGCEMPQHKLNIVCTKDQTALLVTHGGMLKRSAENDYMCKCLGMRK